MRCELRCVRYVANLYLKGYKEVKTWTKKLKKEGKTLFDLDRYLTFDI